MTGYVNLPGTCCACGLYVEDRPRHTVICLPMAVALDREYWPYDSEQSAHFAQLKKGGLKKARKEGRLQRGGEQFRNYANRRGVPSAR